MTAKRIAFAIPGDIDTVTGGYFYDRQLINGLRQLGREVLHIPLAASFPNPTQADMQNAALQLDALPDDCPVIIDGLAMGGMVPAVLAEIRTPIIALVHHPLAYESGLAASQRAHFLSNERATLGFAKHVFVPSPHTAELLTSHYDVVPNKITIARPGAKRAIVTATRSDPPLILSVGIQVPRKGHDVLLQALARLTDLPWQAVIAGGAFDPDHSADLVALQKQLKLSNRVRIAGQIAENEMNFLYAKASIFVLATRHEGYGIVFDEAMVHGLPIVTCNVGAVPNTVSSDAALLVAPDDPIEFAKALQSLLTDAVLRQALSHASAETGASLPSWEVTTKTVAETLDMVVQN